jgi:hypothetical protein
MTRIESLVLFSNAAVHMRLRAASGVWNGKFIDEYFMSCAWYIEQFEATAYFMKEEGYHTGGWWKNPDYERCWHLSLSFKGGYDKSATQSIIDALFGENKKLLWIEPPYSMPGKKADVWHYRLFADEHWNPIKPKGEVYSTQFTERGWKSFSELNETDKKIEVK